MGYGLQDHGAQEPPILLGKFWLPLSTWKCQLYAWTYCANSPFASLITKRKLQGRYPLNLIGSGALCTLVGFTFWQKCEFYKVHLLCSAYNISIDGNGPHSPRNRVGAIRQLHCWKSIAACLHMQNGMVQGQWSMVHWAWCKGHVAKGMVHGSMVHVQGGTMQYLWNQRHPPPPLHYLWNQRHQVSLFSETCLRFHRRVSDFRDILIIKI